MIKAAATFGSFFSAINYLKKIHELSAYSHRVYVEAQESLIFVYFTILSNDEHVFRNNHVLNDLGNLVTCLLCTLQTCTCCALVYLNSLNQSVHDISLTNWIHTTTIAQLLHCFSNHKSQFRVLIKRYFYFAWGSRLRLHNLGLVLLLALILFGFILLK